MKEIQTRRRNSTKGRKAASVPIPPHRELPMPHKGYQPSKAEQEEEIDMPGMSEEQMRDTFYRPFRVVRRGKNGSEE